MTGNEYAAETDWSKEQDKGKVSKGRNTKRQNRSIQMRSLNDTREKILPDPTSFLKFGFETTLDVMRIARRSRVE